MFFLLSGYTLKKREMTHEYINVKYRCLLVPYLLYLSGDFSRRYILKNYYVNQGSEMVSHIKGYWYVARLLQILLKGWDGSAADYISRTNVSDSRDKFYVIKFLKEVIS